MSRATRQSALLQQHKVSLQSQTQIGLSKQSVPSALTWREEFQNFNKRHRMGHSRDPAWEEYARVTGIGPASKKTVDPSLQDFIKVAH
jgi:hypothetical protein